MSLLRKKFDAYMIDYIKKLDVADSTNLIIVEYKKEAKDVDYNTIRPYNDTTRKFEETYIASLEWS